MKVLAAIIVFCALISIVAASNDAIVSYRPSELINFGFHFANASGDIAGADCNIQIRESNFTILEDSLMNEIGGGWYNFTYNTSQLGNYQCRQNCTSGTGFFESKTCNFIIEGEQEMIFAAIILIPLFIAAFLLIVSWILPKEKFSALKIGLILLGFVFIFQSYQYGAMSAAKFYNYTEMVDAIGDNTFIYGMVFWFILIVFIFSFLWDVFMLFDEKRHKTGEY